jgi:hypothetical protein
MRKHSLRQAANIYLYSTGQGCHRDRKHRDYVIRRLIDDLYIIGHVPPTWHALTVEHLQGLVLHWQQSKIKPSTIMKYMTVIRKFLQVIDYKKEIPDNRSLGVKREVTLQKSKSVSPDIWQKTSDPIVRVLLGLQIHFGLTVSEAMRVIPDIHVRQSNLWLTREITFNSMDRIVPLRNDIQEDILGELSQLTQNHQSLIYAQGHRVVCFRLNRALRALKLPVSKCWRYLYARQMDQQLSSILEQNELFLLIMSEMGVKSRTTLWRYLKN